MSKIIKNKFFKIILLLLSFGFIYSEPASACATITNIPIGSTDYQIKAKGGALACFVYVYLTQVTSTTPTTTGNQTSAYAQDDKPPDYPYTLETNLWFIPSYSQGTGIRCFETIISLSYYDPASSDPTGVLLTEIKTKPELCYLPFPPA